MASIRKRQGSGRWYACITLPDGRQRQFSTGLTDQAEALAVAVAAERAARRHCETPHQLRAALDRLAEEFIPPEDADPVRWFREWAASKKNEVSEATLVAYTTTATETADWLVAAGISHFSAVTGARVKGLRDHWALNTSGVTVNKKLKHLRMAFGEAMRQQKIAVNPAVGVPAVNEAATRRREFRPAEIEILLPTLTGDWRALFLLGLYTGQRLNDLTGLRWSQVDLAAQTITLQARKTDALVALPLMRSVTEALAELPSSDDPEARIFPKVWKMKEESRSNKFRGLLYKVGLATNPNSKAMVKGGPRVTSVLSFHSLRHTATSMLKAAGVSDSIARAIIGHESAAVSRAYTHLDMATMRAAMEKMPPHGEGGSVS